MAWRAVTRTMAASAGASTAAPPQLLQLGGDLLHLILQRCDFDTLRVLLSTSRTLEGFARDTLRSVEWRSDANHERALRLAAWESSLEETCLGTFVGSDGAAQSGLNGIDMHGHRVAGCRRGHLWASREVKCFDVAATVPGCTHAFDARARQPHFMGGVVAVRLRGETLAVLLKSLPKPTPGGTHSLAELILWQNSVRLFDLASAAPLGPSSGVSLDQAPLDLASAAPLGPSSGVSLDQAPLKDRDPYFEVDIGWAGVEMELLVWFGIGSIDPFVAQNPATLVQHLRVWRVPRDRLSESTQLASATLPHGVGWTAEVAAAQGTTFTPNWREGSNQRIAHGFAVHGSVVAVLTGPCSLELLSLPALQPLRTLTLAGPSRPGSAQWDGWIAGRSGRDGSRHVGLGSAHLALVGSAYPGSDEASDHHPKKQRLLLWTLALLLDPSVRGLAEPAVLLPDEDDAAGLWGWNTIATLAMSSNLVAACFAGLSAGGWSLKNRVIVWDSATQQQVSEVGLPSRQHAHFHHNVIVQNSLTEYGAHLALDDFRIALSAKCSPGTWLEDMRSEGSQDLGGASSQEAGAAALLVVQEVGPSWLRG